MNKQKETWYYLYRTLNIVNGKEYIGVHKTSNLRDGYIGCGIYTQKDAKRFSKVKASPFIHAVCKHGYENFIKEVLYHFNSDEEAYKKEKEVVDLDYIEKENTYNITIGGKGGANKSSMKCYDVVDEKGVRHVGTNIKEFCRCNDIGYAAFKALIRGNTLISQGYSLTKNNIITDKIVIVNLVTNDVYETFNINRWCRENLPDSVTSTSVYYLQNVLLNKTLTYKKTWWCCYEKDWTGEVKIEYVDYTKKI
jgi:hypothetical protein